MVRKSYFNNDVMKKVYLKPAIEVSEIEMMDIIASSPNISIGGDIVDGTTDVSGLRTPWLLF